MNLQNQLSYGAYNPKLLKVMVKESWTLSSATLLFKMIEILRKRQPREETSEIHLYGEYSSPSTHSLNLHIYVSQQLNHAT